MNIKKKRILKKKENETFNFAYNKIRHFIRTFKRKRKQRRHLNQRIQIKNSEISRKLFANANQSVFALS